LKEFDWAAILRWAGNLNEVDAVFVTPHFVGVVCIAVSGVCGAIVGFEREKRSKPAGLRTLILICTGSTVFTLASLLISTGQFSDPGRIAAQVVTGVGFLGAGAIIQERRAVVVGLTTGATIWTVAAIGVVVGTGYAAAGIVLSLLIFLILTGIRAVESWLVGACSVKKVRVVFRCRHGKTRHRIQGILDDFQTDPATYEFVLFEGVSDGEEDRELEALEIDYCTSHSNHRAFLADVVRLGEVESVEDDFRGSPSAASVPQGVDAAH
jgi:putative Mg2+ transporter-C (MgtC) family protein